MTNRKQWKIGASSPIVTQIYGLTDYAFRQYSESDIVYTEISTTRQELNKFGFIEDPEKMLELTNKYGIKIWSLHIPFAQDFHPAILDEALDKEFMNETCNYILSGIKIGIETFVIHPSSEPNEKKDRENLIEKSIKNLSILAKLCHDNGAVLAVENLPRTCLCNNADEMLRIVKSVPHLQICFDTNHLLSQNNIDYLDKLILGGMRGKIRTVHISDYDFVDERHWLPKEGKNNWEGILYRLEALDYNGVFMYEVSRGFDRDFYYTIEQIHQNAIDILGK